MADLETSAVEVGSNCSSSKAMKPIFWIHPSRFFDELDDWP